MHTKRVIVPKLPHDLQDEIEESMLKRINIIAQNGNTGEHYDYDPLGDIEVHNEKTL